MTIKKSTKRLVAPLVIESHPTEYQGYPFITLITYRKEHMLTIVDNSDEENISVYVLDRCDAEQVDEESLIAVAVDWYEHSRNKFPLSIELSKRNMTKETSRIYRMLTIEYVSRVIGPKPVFPISNIKAIRRRKRKPISPGIEIVNSSKPSLVEEFFN